MTALETLLRTDDAIAQRVIFNALKSSSVMYLARRIATRRAALIEAAGPVGIVAEAVELGSADESALCARLADEAAALDRMIADAREGSATLDAFCKESQRQFAAYVSRAVRTELDVGSVEIPHLEGLIRGFERARADHRERLVEAGLDDGQIERGGLLKPTADDLLCWRRELAEKREQVARAKAFLASAPLFDLSILGEDA
ncbi:hypothetical protein [Paraburkholderia sp. J63]|uniref:hypothetical protein n=1 Tax=Paraburkholderia sp. J63 TaxID=2805434 RepID=UPI002ABE3655|nr:hypothetical protein [Paraburkholderia sp. J63]